MTAKRFTTDYEDFLKEDMTFIKNNDKRMTFQEVVNLLNELHEENEELKQSQRSTLREFRKMSKRLQQLAKKNEQLKQRLQKIQNSFEVNWTQNYVEFNKDKLYIKDSNTEIRLNGTNLFIEVYIPQTNEYYRFKYIVTGRSLIKEFIENYNSNGD